MKRRTFVQSGVAGALGFSLQPAGLRFSTPNQHDIHVWLRRLSKSIKSRHIWAPRVLSDTDLQMTKSLDAYFSKRYFQRESSMVNLIANTEVSYFFYPVYLRHASAGVCDVLLPFFKRQGDNTWRHIGTFTGFQVEALARAVELLKDSDVASLLLPVAAGRTEGPVYSYKSSAGSVAISTIVKEKGNTTLRVYKGDQLVLEESFESAHCLNSGNI